MPLISIPELISHARTSGYAIGYFESWSMDSLQGVIDAAELSRSPVIIGFNGEFLSRPDRKASERLAWYGALGKAVALSASVPCGFIFNECPDDSWVRQAVTAGFNLVMPVPAEGEPESAYTARVRAITDYAHGKQVAVEAEIGTLPFGDGDEHLGSEATDPQRASAFVAATHIDLLAVSVGNVHVLLHGQKSLDLARLAALHKMVSTPFVLHGGTGIDDESLKAAIGLGIVKVNYGTVLKQHYLEALRHSLGSADPNPHHLLGYGGQSDVMVAGRLAVRDAVLAKMEILGCVGRA
ncbi:MAG: class II fructose-bisphosphate aldolase [Aggregatilineales bacterium]